MHDKPRPPQPSLDPTLALWRDRETKSLTLVVRTPSKGGYLWSVSDALDVAWVTVFRQPAALKYEQCGCIGGYLLLTLKPFAYPPAL